MSTWKNQDLEHPMVSVVCLTYNHEKYIKDALNGFLIQETDFPFEVLVNEDTSTDDTAIILKEYEKKYQNIIKPIYHTVNEYSQDIDVFGNTVKRTKGKYIAICEGDDFWIDKNKLQMQVDFLEKNLEYSMCCHNAQVVNELNKISTICFYIGDAGTATIIDKGSFAESFFELGTDGRRNSSIRINAKNGGRTPLPAKSLNEILQKDRNIRSDVQMFMDGASIFSFTLKQVPKLVKNVLERNQKQMDDIDYFVFYQANVYILEYLRKKLKVENERFAYFIEDIGNTVSNSIPIVLSEKLKDETLYTKKHILLAGFGVGLSWSGCMLEKI
ncbi:Beta-ketoacyl-acyl-carrier-protein synthase III [Treponema brennaborense DSM 12168]|uniref:Beta-ketoacyl-acyl-carrier-protein synthase III n=2 Tax=Treponema TaxID=157 RepID=F4LID8_TREBD|nr:Beta-ketoacyl-acyl-carrier-protein synthase III [Treponema brennaborense DSM 12168]